MPELLQRLRSSLLPLLLPFLLAAGLVWLGQGWALAQASGSAATGSTATGEPPSAPWSDADIRASRTETPGAKALPARPRWQADPMNLFVVVESGDHHVSLVDGDRFVVLHRFASRDLRGGPKFTPDGRYAYFGSSDGWISKIDLWNLALVAEVRAGRDMRNLALSGDGHYLMAANTVPRNVVVFNADLQLVKHLNAATLDGKQTSRVSAVYTAAPRKSFVVALKDIAELWEVSYDEKAEPIYDGLVHDYKMGEAIATPGFLNPRRTPLDAPLDDFFFDPSHRNLLGTTRSQGGAAAGSTTVQVVNLDVRRKIAELPIAGIPQLGSGTSFAWNGSTVLASPNLKDGAVDVIDLRTWKTTKIVPTHGPGSFVRSHANTRYAWADSAMGAETKDTLTLIDRKTLAPAATLRVSGHSLAHTDFTHDGRYALVSVWETDGAVIVYDADTLKEVKRLPMKKPSGAYNVGNQLARPASAPR